MMGQLSRLLVWLGAKWQITRRSLVTLVIVLWACLISYAALVNTVDPSGFGLVDDKTRPFWAKFGAVSALLLVLLRPLWQALRSDGSLRHIVVADADKTDLKQMAKAMKKADVVTIYSGDFSYVYDHDGLYNILKELAERENLTFISYKSQHTVLAKSESSRKDKECLICLLMQSNSIYFDVPGKAKFSLIYRRGEEVLLYRHREGGVDYITVFRATNGMSKQLVETMKTLVNVAIAKTSDQKDPMASA